ncbi:MAG: hypothetical protein MJB12_14420 [Firmicutes bacterium]|nr:hypothetical protein [Bacillota bacterium]
MSRLQWYKRRKRHKRLVLLTIFLSLVIVTVGLLTVNSAVNTMLGAEDELKLVSLIQKADSIYRLSIMNYTSEINLSYIKEDLNNAVAKGKAVGREIEEYLYEFSDYAKAVMSRLE